ncbi:MAG: hypothetical protein GC168_09630 [Candidatus Hydrogenedens sp.]|nr:hypothetical protein [Candidatus Hydrogenedens sp.]
MNISLLEVVGASLAAGQASGKKDAPVEGGLFAALLAALNTEAAKAATAAGAAPVVAETTPDAEALAATAETSETSEAEAVVAAETETPVEEAPDDVPPTLPPAAAAELAVEAGAAPPAPAVAVTATTASADSTTETPDAVAPTAAPESTEAGTPVLRVAAAAAGTTPTAPETPAVVEAESAAPVVSAKAPDPEAVETTPKATAAEAKAPAAEATPVTTPPVQETEAAAPETIRWVRATPEVKRESNAVPAKMEAVAAKAESVEPVLSKTVPAESLDAKAAVPKPAAAPTVEQTVRVAETSPVPVLRAAVALQQPVAEDGESVDLEETTVAKSGTLLSGLDEAVESTKSVETPEAVKAPKRAPEHAVRETAEAVLAKESVVPDGLAPRAEHAPAASSPDTPGLVAAKGIESAPRTEALAAPASTPSQSPMPDRVPLPEIGRAAASGVKQLAAAGGGTLVIRVVPESLGDVRIEVRREDGQISVKLTAATQSVRDALETGAHGLREALAREGIELRQVQVQSSAPANSGQPQTHLQQGQSQQQAQQEAGAGQRGAGSYRQGPEGAPQRESYPSGRDDRGNRPAHHGALNVWA